MTRGTALFIGSHNEEIEVEAPLVPQLLVESGMRVVIFNPIGGWNWCAIRRLPDRQRESLKQSAIQAANILGCEKILCDFDVGRSYDWKHRVLQETVNILADVKPDIVFIHWPYDSHFDHRAVADISFQALRSCANLIEDSSFEHTWKEIWAYSAGREQSLNFVPDVLACADERHMQKAKEAIDAFSYEDSRKHIWKQWTYRKCQYWAPFDESYPYADPLRYIGPEFPAEGTLLKKVLGERLKSHSTSLWLAK